MFTVGRLGRKQIADVWDVFQEWNSCFAGSEFLFLETADDETAVTVRQTHRLGYRVFI